MSDNFSIWKDEKKISYRQSPAEKRLYLSCGEGVALFQITALEPAAEPTDTLRRTTVRKALRDDVALSALLNPIVADLRRCV